MPTGYQIYDQTAPYFLTLQVIGWVDLFTRSTYRDIIINSLKYCQNHKGLEIFAWVIMSNHLHLMVRSSTGELSGTLRDFKKFTSKSIINEINSGNESRKCWMLNLFRERSGLTNKIPGFQVWTHENHAEQLYSNHFIQQKLDYIHMNPVRAKIVENPYDYIYSSSKSYADMDGLIDIVKVGDSFSERF